MQAQTAVVLGATGFIGRHLISELVNDPAFSKVRLLVRKAIVYEHEKVEVAVTDFSKMEDYKARLGTGDSIFCCIGTTMKKVQGDKAAYRKIDFDIPVNAATIGRQAGFTRYILVSSVGANASASNFYLQLKGQVEEAIAVVGFKALHIFRPSMLMGDRQEARMGESIAKGLMHVVSPLMFGKLSKYKGVHGKVVAKSMVEAAKSKMVGVKVYEYNDIIQSA
jgi:uncharacterized protein YbjT (DUF2867 family)